MLCLKEMKDSIFGWKPILFLLLQSLLTGLPLLPSMSQIILLKWGRELGASLQTFQVFYPFFIFFIRFSEIGLWNTTGQVRKIYHFSFFPWLRQLNQLIYFTKVKGANVELQCNSSNSKGFSPAENKIQLFGIQKLFLSQYFLHCLVCLSERLQFSDERFCLTRKYLLSPAAPFILDANVFQSQYCYNISHLSTSPQDKYTKVGNTAYNN